MSILDTPRYWWDRAEEARAISELMSDLDAKRRMLQVARGYARHATRIGELQARDSHADLILQTPKFTNTRNT